MDTQAEAKTISATLNDFTHFELDQLLKLKSSTLDIDGAMASRERSEHVEHLEHFLCPERSKKFYWKLTETYQPQLDRNELKFRWTELVRDITSSLLSELRLVRNHDLWQVIESIFSSIQPNLKPSAISKVIKQIIAGYKLTDETRDYILQKIQDLKLESLLSNKNTDNLKQFFDDSKHLKLQCEERWSKLIIQVIQKSEPLLGKKEVESLVYAAALEECQNFFKIASAYNNSLSFFAEHELVTLTDDMTQHLIFLAETEGLISALTNKTAEELVTLRENPLGVNNKTWNSSIHRVAIDIRINRKIESQCASYEKATSEHDKNTNLSIEAIKQNEAVLATTMLQHLRKQVDETQLIHSLTNKTLIELEDFYAKKVQENNKMSDEHASLQSHFANYEATLQETRSIVKNYSAIRNNKFCSPLATKLAGQTIDEACTDKNGRTFLDKAILLGDVYVTSLVLKHAHYTEIKIELLCDALIKLLNADASIKQQGLLHLAAQGCMFDHSLVREIIKHSNSKRVLQLFDKNDCLILTEELLTSIDAKMLIELAQHVDNLQWPLVHSVIVRHYSLETNAEIVFPPLLQEILQNKCARNERFIMLTNVFEKIVAYIIDKYHKDPDHYHSKLKIIFNAFQNDHFFDSTENLQQHASAIIAHLTTPGSELSHWRKKGCFTFYEHPKTHRLIKEATKHLTLDAEISPENSPKNLLDQTAERTGEKQKRDVLVRHLFKKTQSHLNAHQHNDEKLSIINSSIQMYVNGKLPAGDLINTIEGQITLGEHTSHAGLFKKVKRSLKKELKKSTLLTAHAI